MTEIGQGNAFAERFSTNPQLMYQLVDWELQCGSCCCRTRWKEQFEKRGLISIETKTVEVVRRMA